MEIGRRKWLLADKKWGLIDSISSCFKDVIHLPKSSVMVELAELLSGFYPISLEDMSSIRLMNRTDTKYIVSVDQLSTILKLAMKEYYVQEIDEDRNIPYHTIYYDTPGYEMYLSHHNGRKVREKIRVRTYINSQLTFLEIKHKNNKGRTNKKRIRVNNTNAVSTERGEVFIREHGWSDPLVLLQHLENQFDRITLVNRGKTERLTIDTNIHFHNFSTGKDSRLKKLVIIELKRDGYTYSPMCEILKRLRIHEERISKYCVGAVLTNPDLKYNRLKQKIHRIKEIEKQI